MVTKQIRMIVTNNCADCTIGSSCFQKLFPEELEFINLKKTQISYAKGENICKQGAFASYVLYVSSGLVKLYVENSGRKMTNIQILKNSDFIGLSSIYGDNIYSFSAKALQDTDVCLIEKDAIRSLIEKNGHFASSLIKNYCITEQNLFGKIRSISYKQMNGRLADTLLYLSSINLPDKNIYNFLGRQDIADFACISKESTVKLLTEFKAEGIIEMEGKKVAILDQEKLVSISKRG